MKKPVCEAISLVRNPVFLQPFENAGKQLYFGPEFASLFRLFTRDNPGADRTAEDLADTA